MQQREFPWLAAMKPPQDVPRRILGAIESEEQAVALSIRLSRQSQARLAKRLGISPAYLSAIKSGERIVPAWFVRPFCYATGCNALRQFRDLQTALRMVDNTRQRDVLGELARACEASWQAAA